MTFEEGWKKCREGWKKWLGDRRKAGIEWWGNLREVWNELHYIERPVGVGLFVLKAFVLTELIPLLFWNWKANQKWEKWLPDCYVGLVTVFLFILLVWSPIRWVAIYFLGSIIVYLLNVVLVDHK